MESGLKNKALTLNVGGELKAAPFSREGVRPLLVESILAVVGTSLMEPFAIALCSAVI